MDNERRERLERLEINTRIDKMLLESEEISNRIKIMALESQKLSLMNRKIFLETIFYPFVVIGSLAGLITFLISYFFK